MVCHILVRPEIPQERMPAASKGPLSRAQAVSRMRTLLAGCEEHTQLQNALLKTSCIVEICLPAASYKVDTISDKCAMLGGFGSSEHVAIGESVTLKGLPEGDKTLLTKGFTELRFPHIVALAGDFYGVPNAPISLVVGADAEAETKRSEKEKTKRFLNAFETLAGASNDQVRRICFEIDQECLSVKHSGLPHHCYSSQLVEKDKAIKAIKSDVRDLLIDNSDHFSTHAREAYRIGHAHARNVAKEAGKKRDVEGLRQAYAMDAFACHFLTDLFAGGHIDNQRGQLEDILVVKLGFDPWLAKVLAGVLTGAQHEKFGKEGLNVSNRNGNMWRAYGDGLFFDSKNDDNREYVKAAVQLSVDEVYAAYESPETDNPSTIDRHIPQVAALNPMPIYSIKEGELFLHIRSEAFQMRSQTQFNEGELFSCVRNKGAQIKTQAQFLYLGLSLALAYLPEDYVFGFINPFNVELPAIHERLIIPLVERITSPIWHTLGLATYLQVKQETQKLSGKIDEMADVLRATHENTVLILNEINAIQDQLADLRWANELREVQAAIGLIKVAKHAYGSYGNMMDPEQLKDLEKQLWRGHTELSTVLCEGDDGDINGSRILQAYVRLLNWQKKDPEEVKIMTTSWLRELLDYQAQALKLYLTLKLLRGGIRNDEVTPWTYAFESTLLKQIRANRALIDERIIYTSPAYIAQQHKRLKTKQAAFARLSTTN